LNSQDTHLSPSFTIIRFFGPVLKLLLSDNHKREHITDGGSGGQAGEERSGLELMMPSTSRECKRERRPADQRARQAREGQGEDRGYEHQWGVQEREKRPADQEARQAREG
jgi:hypothetical protein